MQKKQQTNSKQTNNMISTSTIAIVNWKGDPEGIFRW